MHQARWNQIEELLQAALDVVPSERAAFLTRTCGSDHELYRQVEALLGNEEQASILESPAVLSVPPPSLSGQQLGHYRVLSRIGAGGMGEVYEARDERLQRIVALKALPAEFTADADRVRRFEQEAFAASRLNHPNIITIFEVVHAGDTHLIATERVEGRTLRDMFSEKIGVETALDIAIQIAAALEAAHTAWIIHRDIKPENIMVRSDGVVKVLDFGIAKVSEDLPPLAPTPIPIRGDTPNLTVPGSVLGTASYMSPEQARGEILDGRTDLYSLGLILCEMITGQRVAAVEHLPRELQRLVRKLLQPAREHRHASAAELLDDLQSVKRRLESRTARRMVGLGVLAVIAAVAIAGGAALLSINESWDERVLRDGHAAAARQAAFSPDGRLLVSCGEDGQVIVWDFARRERVATLDHSALRAVFSGDGRWCATGGTDGTIAIWDARSWKRSRVLERSGGEVTALAFSPDSSVLLSAAAATHGTNLWDARSWTRRSMWAPGRSPYGNVVFSRDGTQAMFSLFSVYDLSQGRLISEQPKERANWIALSPDETQLAAIDALGGVVFYRLTRPGDLSTAQQITRLRAHQDHGRSVAYSPDGRLVASAADDILLWDAATQQKLARFEHTAIVWNVAFSPDGRWLVSTHGDGAVLVWDVAERARIANLNEHSGAVRAVAFSADGRRAASASDDRSVTVWDLDPARKRAVLAWHPARVNGVGFLAGSGLATADHESNVVFWDLRTRTPKAIMTPGPGVFTYCLAVSPDRRLVATSHGIYRTSDGRRIVDFYIHPYGPDWNMGHVYGAAFSADGRVLAAVTNEGWLMVWDTQTLRIVERRRIAGTHQIAVAVSPDAKWLVAGEDEGRVRLWSVAPLREVAILGRHAARVKSIAFSPDGKTVASAGDDKMIALWDIKRRKLRTRIGVHASPVNSVAFSPDGRRLASGEHDRSVRIYTRRRSVWGVSLD